MCFFIFNIGGPGGKVYSTLELKSLAEVGLGSRCFATSSMFGAFNIQHLVVVSFLFLSLFEALFKARLFFSGQKKEV